MRKDSERIGDMERLKILHILASMPSGGIGGYLKNIYGRIDKDAFEFEFLIMSDDKRGEFADYMSQLGAKVHFLPSISLSQTFKIRREFEEFFKTHSYDIVELHALNMAFLCADAIKQYTTAKFIIHLHNTKYSYSWVKGIRNYILSLPMKGWADYYIACGEAVAHKMLYRRNVRKEKVFVMPNPINCAIEPSCDSDICRKLEEVESCIAVGNLLPAKNQLFLLKVFRYLKEVSSNIKLFIVGEGVLRAEMETFINQNNLANVTLLGYRTDVLSLMKSSKLMLMPSKFEGLPVTMLEAQALGLPIIASDKISSETKVNDNVIFLPINEKDVELWAEEIKKRVDFDKADNGKMLNSVYNIDVMIGKLEEDYRNLVMGDKGKKHE